MKKSFITELNKFVSIYGGISYFGEKTNNNLIDIVIPKISLECSLEDVSQIENATAETADIVDKKYEFAIIHTKNPKDWK